MQVRRMRPDEPCTGIMEVPITALHKPPANLEMVLTNPGVARATQAADAELPNGGPVVSPSQTSLQQHFEYFDYDGDGTIYPWESFTTMRYLRWGPEPINSIVAVMGTMLFHVGLSYFTQDSWIPNPLMAINIANAHRTKHGSTSKSWDHEGRFTPEKFEEIFSKYDVGNNGGLCLYDIFRMIRGQHNLFDILGTMATTGEWLMAWYLHHDKRGILSKEDMRGQFDGSAYYRLAERNGYTHYGLNAKAAKLSKKNSAAQHKIQ